MCASRGSRLALFELIGGAYLHNGFVERLGRAEAFGVPRGDFAEHHAAAIFAEDLDHQFIMPAQNADAFVKGGSVRSSPFSI